MRMLSGRAAEARVDELAERRSHLSAVEPVVTPIVEAVRRRGDPALRHYAAKWDGLAPRQSMRVPQSEIDGAWNTVTPALRASLRETVTNIQRYCKWQAPREWRRDRGGMSLGQLVRPLDSVGCYVPGGRHPLLSTLLMTVIPAQVAGVRQIRVVSPHPRAEVLAAAALLGVAEFYRVGGAHAIAALAYGTSSISRVDKIVGPGNRYVTAAKKLVSFDCSIDFLAGPTEAVICSSRGRAEFIAADLLAQAEHDPDALSVFITTSQPLMQAVRSRVNRLVHHHPTARQSLGRNGAILLAPSRERALAWVNQIAPEHVTVDREDVPFIRSAGSVFVGNYSAQAAGDYASGANHVLPTAGMARFRGGLHVLDFVKLIAVQELSSQALERIGPTVVCLANAEGLRAHAESVRARCKRA